MAPNDNPSQYLAQSRAFSRFGAGVSPLRSLNTFSSAILFRVGVAVALFVAAPPLFAAAQDAPQQLAPMPVSMLPSAMFPQIRSLSLASARALALKRSPAIALSAAKIAAAEADRRDVSRRLKVGTTGGLDPFSGKIRFYLALDLERLAGLNRAQKDGAAQKVEAERIGGISTQQDAIKRVSAAWYSLAAAQMSIESTARRKETARALYVAADARFKAGASELSGVLSALSATSEADDAFQSARQAVALSCLELAQSCGYMTAEEMEAALSGVLSP